MDMSALDDEIEIAGDGEERVRDKRRVIAEDLSGSRYNNNN